MLNDYMLNQITEDPHDFLKQLNLASELYKQACVAVITDVKKLQRGYKFFSGCFILQQRDLLRAI